jgi:NTE family protein
MPGTVSHSERTIVPILAGGGTRLPAHIGILKALEELGVDFRHIVGVSGGSIISSLYAAGRSIEEIREIAFQTDFNRFRGFSLLQLIRHGGLSDGDRFEQWMDELLEGRTFEQLERTLHVIATDVKNGEPVVFSARESPGLKVATAVRFSMSIPLIFSFKHFGPHILVDGSILSEDALHRDWAGDGTPQVCFRTRGERRLNELEPSGFFRIKDYITLLIRTFMTTINREYVSEDYWRNTVIVNTGELSPIDFSISVEQKQQLFELGYRQTLEYVPAKVLSSRTGTQGSAEAHPQGAGAGPTSV